MGGGAGEVHKKYSRKAKLNEKNSCTPINPKKYSCYGPKKIHTRNLITKKNSCRSKIPHPPHNFSNGPSLISVMVSIKGNCTREGPFLVHWSLPVWRHVIHRWFSKWRANFLFVMYRSNRSFNMPPRANPRACDFFEIFCSNSPLPGPRCRSNAAH